MSYVVLARKYRPPDFAGLVGQEHVVQALSNALTRQRLHHAYLFTGTRGVGKTTISRILAKSLNCTGVDGSGGITAHPCGRCDACRDIDTGRFIDYVELDAASNRGVDEISQLLDQAVYKPVVGRFKVYMIDEVHMLSNTAFNAMLKTLEEPPEYLKFVLATTDPQKVPPTVLSRCLQFNLRPMAPQTVQLHLAEVLAKEQIGFEVGALRLLARAARGSMRDALSLTDQAIAFGAGGLDEAGVRQMLGAVDRGHAVRAIEAVAASDGAALVGAVDELRGLGLSAAGTLEEVASLLQQMAVLQVVPDAGDPDDPDSPDARRLSLLFEADETQLLYSIAIHGRGELALAPDEYSGLVMVLLRMLAFRPDAARTSGPAAEAAPTRATPVRPSTTVAPPSRPSAVAKAVTRVPDEAVLRVPVASERGSALPVAAPPVAATPVAAKPAAMAPAPAVRVSAKAMEPPPWMDDEPPFDGEVDGSASGTELFVTGHVAPARLHDSPGASPPVKTGGVAPATFERTALGDRWDELVGGLIAAGQVSAFARELAMQAECIGLEEQATPVVCRLRVERESLRAQAPREKLEAALAQALSRAIRLELEPGVAEDSPARRDAAARARRQAEAEQIIHDDPLVQALMAQYKTARIVPGSVKPH